MVATRRSTERSGVVLRAAALQRQSQRSAARSRPKRGTSNVPDVYQEMLVEAGVGPSQQKKARSAEASEPPAKRPKRPGEKSSITQRETVPHPVEEEKEDDGEDEDENMEFEDIAIPAPVIQTTERHSEDEEEDDDDNDDAVFEDVHLAAHTTDSRQNAQERPQTLELNLTAHESVLLPLRRGKVPADRKKPLTKAERLVRVAVHKVHVLCLLAHAAQRNRWCNLPSVHAALQPLLTDKLVTYLNPGDHLSQFGRTESLKNGLQQAATVFKTRFTVTERGLKRALWAEDPEQLKDYEPAGDMESTLDKDDFVDAAKTLRGSRDVGAQLFCALLRSAGVEARLVCSLQPLSFVSGAPTLPKPRAATQKTPKKPVHLPKKPEGGGDSDAGPSTASPLRRLGHPQAAAYHVPRQSPSTPSTPPTPAAHVVRGESPFPVYWVEVLDVAHQKWQPVDPLVTNTQWRPGKLEPPVSDRNNQLVYAIGFADDGSAKDVTRRYAKAYNAKTKRTRVDGPAALTTQTPPSSLSSAETPPPLPGNKWLRRALRHYRSAGTSDVDQIEDTELAAIEAREPMPRNVADFQNHPVYALERHLRRHEVLRPGATTVGTVSAGSKAALERIYRRRDVRLAYSADKWYRLGRVVLPNEIPAKWLPKRAKRPDPFGYDDDDMDEEAAAADAAGVPIFTPEQTELYAAPPVVHGRVPKNKFGNIEMYVPSMVPSGGAYVQDDAAARAAFLLCVDYAPALTGFRFEGRRGTAVLHGAVVAAEHADAVRAVVAGLADLEAEAEAERKTRAALRMWAFLLRSLRIRQRIREAAEDRGEEVENEVEHEETDQQIEDAQSDVTEEYDMALDDDGDDDMAGGFLVE